MDRRQDLRKVVCVAQQEQGEDGGGEGLWTQGLLHQKLVFISSHFSIYVLNTFVDSPPAR